MISLVRKGNAVVDGQEFRQWFVGDISTWVRKTGGTYQPKKYGLRASRHVEVKWDPIPKGRDRPGGWTTPSEKTSLSVLVRGKFQVWFRPDPQIPPMEFLLEEEGDYVIWPESVPHTWRAVEDSLIMTVRWLEL